MQSMGVAMALMVTADILFTRNAPHGAALKRPLRTMRDMIATLGSTVQSIAKITTDAAEVTRNSTKSNVDAYQVTMKPTQATADIIRTGNVATADTTTRKVNSESDL